MSRPVVLKAIEKEGKVMGIRVSYILKLLSFSLVSFALLLIVCMIFRLSLKWVGLSAIVPILLYSYFRYIGKKDDVFFIESRLLKFMTANTIRRNRYRLKDKKQME